MTGSWQRTRHCWHRHASGRCTHQPERDRGSFPTTTGVRAVSRTRCLCAHSPAASRVSPATAAPNHSAGPSRRMAELQPDHRRQAERRRRGLQVRVPATRPACTARPDARHESSFPPAQASRCRAAVAGQRPRMAIAIAGIALVGSTLVGSTLVGSTLVSSMLAGSTLAGSVLVGSTLDGSTLKGVRALHGDPIDAASSQPDGGACWRSPQPAASQPVREQPAPTDLGTDLLVADRAVRAVACQCVRVSVRLRSVRPCARWCVVRPAYDISIRLH